MVRLGISKSAKHERRGRVDLFIEPIEDFVTVIEIKSTDWDRIDPHNRKHLLSSHTRQVLKYVDKYLQIDNVNVCAAILYPKSPETAGLKEQIEQYTGDHGLQVAWFE